MEHQGRLTAPQTGGNGFSLAPGPLSLLRFGSKFTQSISERLFSLSADDCRREKCLPGNCVDYFRICRKNKRPRNGKKKGCRKGAEVCVGDCYEAVCG